MLMKKILIIIALFYEIVCTSQNKNLELHYEPKNKDSLMELLDRLYENQVASISNENKKQIKNIYKQRYEGFTKTLHDSIFVFSKTQDSYLNYILDHIYDSNADINSEDFTFFLNRSVIPNAACFGDKTFIVNLGLISLLENEDQYAFILCHEIAHYQLNHVNKNIIGRINTLNSKDVLARAKEIKRQKYGRNKEGLSFLKNLTFDFTKHSRKAEIEADSLGLLLFRKTKYSEVESKRSLQLLGNLEDIIFQDSIQLKHLLDFENYPFKDYWLKKEKSLFEINERIDDYEWDKDSLKTHPDINLRISKLEKFFLEQKNVEKLNFESIKIMTNYQIINSLIDFHKLDLALYFTLKEIQNNQNPEAFYYTKVAQIFLDMYKQRDTHKLGKSVPSVSPITKEKNINEIRQFIHNLEMKNMRKIGYNFCLKYEAIAKDDKEFQEVFEKIKTINNL